MINQQPEPTPNGETKPSGAAASGGGGNLQAVDLDDGRDQAVARRALREQWPITDEIRKAVILRMTSIVLKKSKTRVVKTADGDQVIEVSNDRESTAAARVLVAAEGQNQADDHLNAKYDRADQGIPEQVIEFLTPEERGRVDRVIESMSREPVDDGYIDRS